MKLQELRAIPDNMRMVSSLAILALFLSSVALIVALGKKGAK